MFSRIRIFSTSLLAVTALLAPLAASADPVDPSVGFSLGTNGGGFSLSVPLTQSLSGRFQYTALNENSSANSLDNTYSGKLQARSVSLLADFHPFGNGFIFSTGAFFPNFSIVGNAQPNSDGTYSINGVKYSGITSLSDTAKWTKTSPYFGIGWSPLPNQHGLGFAADLGAAFVGAPQVNVTATGSASGTMPTQAGLAGERQNLQGAMNYTIYPVIDVGLRYRFGKSRAKADSPSDDSAAPESAPAPSGNSNTNEFR
jgi:hypothetical protein